MAHLPLRPGLYGGLAGVAWMTEHTYDRTMHDEKSESGDANEEVDRALTNLVERRPWEREYDLIGGLVGFGVYFLERLPRPSARYALGQIVERLDELARITEVGICWYTPVTRLPEWQQRIAPKGYYNLGLAHGIPGIVALLSRCIRNAISVDVCSRLLTGTVDWLLAMEKPAGHGCRFDVWVTHTRASERASRLAWCYGDVSVAMALYSAGVATRTSRWIDLSHNILIECGDRLDDRSGIQDAGICHGSAGLAHIYNRFFQDSGDLRFRRLAEHWFGRIVEVHAPSGYGGFQSFFPRTLDGSENKVAWRTDASFLTGSSGIGLVLLAGVSRLAPDWDRRLLL